eukprot:6705830-Pyramimonas_sp.AAC.2
MGRGEQDTRAPCVGRVDLVIKLDCTVHGVSESQDLGHWASLANGEQKMRVVLGASRAVLGRSWGPLGPLPTP